MNHYILWVTQADAAQAKKWYTFLEGYSKALGKGKKGCIFLIETREDVSIRERGSIKRETLVVTVKEDLFMKKK